jgi:hypothetical protein
MIPPGLRRIDPDAEVARLAEERELAAGPWYLLADSTFPAGTRRKDDGTDEVTHVRVTITSNGPVALPAGLDRELLDVVRRHRPWPQGGPGD